MKKLAKMFAVLAGLMAAVTLSSCAQFISGTVLGYYYYEGNSSEVWIDKSSGKTGYDACVFDADFKLIGLAEGIEFVKNTSYELKDYKVITTPQTTTTTTTTTTGYSI